MTDAVHKANVCNNKYNNCVIASRSGINTQENNTIQNNQGEQPNINQKIPKKLSRILAKLVIILRVTTGMYAVQNAKYLIRAMNIMGVPK